MGIPKFYRWTSERYPCLYEKIREYQIPEFDNLYLDMNGIIHNCSHPNDEDIHLRIPEANIFRDIFYYIDFLFRMIKPRKVFFMAVDGVAPRAKMNQQRGRRFRSARVAEEQEAEAIRQGEKLPTEERFDSNCITPGTEFMARLHEQLKYFVSVKISTDPLWQREGLHVYLSGHDVPGEGEHKIMDFIRHIRSLPDYNPETRHCLYGLDADLMMLGLSTHELRFSLLREEVKFSKPKKKKQGKNPPQKKLRIKDEKPPVAYDLTNVSVFTSEGNLGLSTLVSNPASSITPSASLVTLSDKSFVGVVNVVPAEKPDPNLGVPRTCSDSQTVQADPLPPPPSDEHSAKGDYKALLPEKTTFFLLHLSLFRDYLDEEFLELRDKLKDHPIITYDLECVIDDWILMNILVGNDFVPHLPSLHIVKGALPMLYRTYMDVLPTLDGYLNESGILNLKRFEVFITRLSQFDLDQFRDTYDDMKYKASKTGKNIVLGEMMFEDDAPFEEEELEPISDELKELARRTEDEIFGSANNKEGNNLICKAVFPDDNDFFSPDDTEEFRLEFLQHKRNYYLTKCEFRKVDRAAVHDFAKEYVRAIQWVLLYYYKGVSSWGWFYPSHYAPFASDLRLFGDYLIEFDKGRPFRPFEQLLGVLPSQSKKLLPVCYQWLMVDSSSPILEYYPLKFELDLNGKRQDWEAVVRIPFIDELKLLSAMENEANKLNEEEKFRNSRGSLHCYRYTKDDTGPVKSHRDLFPELEVSHIKLDKIEEVNYDAALLPKGLHPKADVKKIYQGFPTLKSKVFKSCICIAEVKVFEFYAREESLIVNFEEFDDETDGLKLGKQILGKSIWVNWPHLELALVSAINTRNAKYILGRDNLIIKDPKTTEDAAKKQFDLMAKGLIEKHLKFRGIRLGRLEIIIHARTMEGRKIRCNNVGKVVIENQWSKFEQPFALKTAIYQERVTEMFYMDMETARSYLDLYAQGDQVFYLGDKAFGAMGTVVGHDKGSGSVVVELQHDKGYDESNLKIKTGLSQLKSHDFFPSYVAASKCQISSFALSRLTGRVLVSVEKVRKPSRKASQVAKQKALVDGDGNGESSESDASSEEFPPLEAEIQKHNIGLDLKFNKTNMEVRGYTSKRENQWFYSAKTVKLVNEFAAMFPELVELLGRADKNKDVYNAVDIYPDDPVGKIMAIVQWLDEKGVRDLPRIPTNCNVLDDEDIETIWKYIVERKQDAAGPVQRSQWTVRPNLLYKPGLDKGCIAPIPNAQFALLDRVICADRGVSVPLGLRGTVVGIQAPPKSSDDDNEEAFKIVGADALNSLIIMCDPTADIFDTPIVNCTRKENGELTALTGTLAKLLGVNGTTEHRAENKTQRKPKPKLIKLFPYQVINLTQGGANLRQDLKKTVRAAKPLSQDSSSLHSGTVIVSKTFAQSVTGVSGPHSAKTDIKILRRNKPSPDVKVPPEAKTTESSKPILEWPPKPLNKLSITPAQLFAEEAEAQAKKQLRQGGQNDLSKLMSFQSLKKFPQMEVQKSPNSETEIESDKPVSVKKATANNRQNKIKLPKSNLGSCQQQGTTTKIFVNSSLQTRTEKRSQQRKNNVEIKKHPSRTEAWSSTNAVEPTDSVRPAQQSQPQNPILNLLCQPKNVERVERVNFGTTQSEARQQPQMNGHKVPLVHAGNGSLSHPHFTFNAAATQPMFILPSSVPIPMYNMLGPPHQVHRFVAHPTTYYPSPNYCVPNPYPITSGLTSQLSAFTPSVHGAYQEPRYAQPNLTAPPPPPQRWTQVTNQISYNEFGNSQGHRQTREPKTGSMFIPLQVSRSMAGGNDTDANNFTRTESIIPAEVSQPIQNVSVSPLHPQHVPQQQQSSTLKALLGVGVKSTSPELKTVQPPRRSRNAANFGGQILMRN